MDLPGLAIKDYFLGHRKNRLYVHDEFGPKTEMPVSVYFREERQMPELEKTALETCRGKVLDIGAGSGVHSLILQQRGFEVTGMEISPASCEVMRHEGLKKVIEGDFFQYDFQEKYDTLMLLMNGIGLCDNVPRLKVFLKRAGEILTPGGQLIFDSCDIAYMYEGVGFPTNTYYGEMKVRYEYKAQFTDWFSWLYIDQNKMKSVAEEEGWKFECLDEDENDQYLAKLTKK